MKILYCNKYNFRFSGTESYLFDTLEAMRGRGHEVALFSMADARGEAAAYDRYLVSHADFKGAKSILSRARLAARAIYSTEARKKIRAAIERFRPDVAHVRNIYHHLSPSILWELKAQGVPVLYHMNDFKLLCPAYNLVSSRGEACEACAAGGFANVVRRKCYPGGVAAATVLALEAYVHRWAGTYQKCVDLILAPSRFAKDKLVESGWNGSKIEVLPHFQSLPQEPEAYPGASAPVVYFGRLSREKGLTDLLAAMAQLPDIRLVIAGDGPQRGELEFWIKAFGLQNVTLAGHLSGVELQTLIASSQFTVFPSHAYETLGKSILESYAQGRAVVASDLGSRRELVEDGETGLLYPVQSPGHLAAAIRFLQERPELARKMGEAGRQLVIEKHSQKQHFAALQGIYERLAQWNISAARPVRVSVAFIGGRGVVGKYSGIESYYEQVGSRLAAKGHEVTAYCRSYFTPKIAEHGGVHIVRLPTIRSKHLDTVVHTFLSTLHACFRKYDIVHYHTLGPSLFSFIPRMLGKKTVVTVQGLDWQRKKWSWFAREALKLGEWASATLPHRTIVVSHALEGRYRSHHAKTAAYIPNGTSPQSRQRRGHLEGFGLAPDDYVLFLGRFSPEKNCDLLIHAFERIETKAKLVLAGGSSHTDDYVAGLRRQEGDRVRFLEWLSGDALKEVLTNAALFVLPSDMEGLSLALLDAMGAGVCVLASDVPENCEVIGDAGFTFRRGDAEDLQGMLTLLLSDPGLRAAAGEKARMRVQQHYLWDQVAAQMEEVYFDLKRTPVIEGALSAATEATRKLA
jgi:glycosyltransferase involved in cell wall biosynthesis